jgi:hypothetical protein
MRNAKPELASTRKNPPCRVRDPPPRPQLASTRKDTPRHILRLVLHVQQPGILHKNAQQLCGAPSRNWLRIAKSPFRRRIGRPRRSAASPTRGPCATTRQSGIPHKNAQQLYAACQAEIGFESQKAASPGRPPPPRTNWLRIAKSTARPTDRPPRPTSPSANCAQRGTTARATPIHIYNKKRPLTQNWLRIAQLAHPTAAPRKIPPGFCALINKS